MIEFKLIFSLVFFFFALLAALIGFLKYKKKKWEFSTSRIIITIIAAVAAMLLSTLVASLIASPAVKLVLQSISKDMADLGQLKSITDALKAFIGMFIAPLFFVPFFFIIRAFLRLAVKPLTELLMKISPKNAEEEQKRAQELEEANNPELSEKEQKKAKKKLKKAKYKNEKITLASSLLGALAGFLTFCVMIIPIVGFTSTVADVVKPALESSEESDIPEMVYGIVDGLSGNAGAVTVNALGGKLLFSGMTSFSVNGHTASLSREAEFAEAVLEAVNASNSDAEKEEIKKAFDKAAKSFKRTTLIPAIASEFLSNATERWDNGEQFMGIEKPKMDGPAGPIVNKVFDTLGDADFNTVREDVATVITMVGTVASNYSLDEITDDFLVVFQNKEVMTDLFASLFANERLSGLISAITETGIQTAGDALNLDKTYADIYNGLSNDLAQSFNALISSSYDPDVKVLTIPETFEKYGIKLNDDSADYFAQVLYSSIGYGATAENVAEMLGSTYLTFEVDQAPVTVMLTSETINQVTAIIPLENIDLYDGKIDDPQKEAQSLTNAFNSIFDLSSKMESEDFDDTDGIAYFGPMFDHIASTQTIGRENVAIILDCILTSSGTCSSMGITVLEGADMAALIHELAADNNESYTSLLQSLAQTIQLIELTSNADADPTEAARELIMNLTPASARTIQRLASTSLLQSNGVTSESADATAGLISDLFGNLADLTESGNLTDEQYDAEANAVADMMNIAMNINSDTSTSVFGGDDSATGITASEYVNRVTSSQVMTQTLMSTVYDEDGNVNHNPLALENELTDEESDEMITALNAEYASENATEEEVVAIAATLNLSVAVVNGQVVRS